MERGRGKHLRLHQYLFSLQLTPDSVLKPEPLTWETCKVAKAGASFCISDVGVEAQTEGTFTLLLNG